MEATLYYFTGTGNSLFIAKTIGSKLPNANLIPINQLDLSKKVQVSSAIVGIIYPTYFLDAPDCIKQLITQLEVSPETYLFLYAHCGATLGNALYNPYSKLTHKGIKVNACYQVCLPDNSIIFPTEPEEQKNMLADGKITISQDAASICKKNNTPAPKRSIKNMILCSIMKTANHVYLGMDEIKIKEEKCTNCGLCIKVCSSNNLSPGNHHPLVSNNCAMCFSCIHTCPQQAIHFKRMKNQSNYQYINPEVSVKELIASRKS